jgi:hypothetical protein
MRSTNVLVEFPGDSLKVVRTISMIRDQCRPRWMPTRIITQYAANQCTSRR